MNPAALVGGGALALLALVGAGGAAVAGSGRRWTLPEFLHSNTARALGIDNYPGPDETAALQALIANVLDPLAREVGGHRIHITSGFRCRQLNKEVGGEPDSQHVLGQAADLQVDGLSPAGVAAIVRRLGLPVDQALIEPTWFHVSYGPRHRREFLVWSASEKHWVPWVAS